MTSVSSVTNSITDLFGFQEDRLKFLQYRKIQKMHTHYYLLTYIYKINVSVITLELKMLSDIISSKLFQQNMNSTLVSRQLISKGSL
jgi:hypothetical protein